MQRNPLIDLVELSKKHCKTPIKAKLKYADSRGKNFVGALINGYHPNATDFALLTKTPALQLCKVQNHLNEKGLGLLVYDAYRPKKAVNHFCLFTKSSSSSDLEAKRKEKHYPSFDKSELFPRGYVAEDSGHCYGNTTDVVLIDLNTGKKLEFGARYDFMDPLSHADVEPPLISEAAHKNRKTLSEAMQLFGFQPYHEEFWHFSYGGKEGREVAEPLDIDITPDLRGFGCKL